MYSVYFLLQGINCGFKPRIWSTFRGSSVRFLSEIKKYIHTHTDKPPPHTGREGKMKVHEVDYVYDRSYVENNDEIIFNDELK